MGLGMFDTCDNSLMVYIFGPQKSRPFTQSVHSFVGAGFVAGILLAKPFLPAQKTTSGDVCPRNETVEIVPEIGISNEYEDFQDDPQEVLIKNLLCFSFLKNARLMLILSRLSKVTAKSNSEKQRNTRKFSTKILFNYRRIQN